MTDCVFCDIVAGKAPADIVSSGFAHIVIRPLKPQVPEHVLIIPRAHVESAKVSPAVAGYLVQQAARTAEVMGAESYNIITSVGAQATQSVFHMHIHLLPRGLDDGVDPHWPWTNLEN